MSEVNISDIREVLRNLVDGTRFTFAQVALLPSCRSRLALLRPQPSTRSGLRFATRT